MNQRVFAWGNCYNLVTKSRLANSLRLQGLQTEERNFSINICNCECFTIEFDAQSESTASFEATAPLLSTLTRDVQNVAAALTACNITFWIEVTDSMQNPLAYYHNHCPEA